jgi:hypothetical protein
VLKLPLHVFRLLVHVLLLVLQVLRLLLQVLKLPLEVFRLLVQVFSLVVHVLRLLLQVFKLSWHWGMPPLAACATPVPKAARLASASAANIVAVRPRADKTLEGFTLNLPVLRSRSDLNICLLSPDLFFAGVFLFAR